MFFLLANGFTLYLLFFLILAIGPAVALMRYVYNLDPLEKEPSGLLSQLILRGVLAAFLAGVFEEVGMSVFGLLSGLDENTLGFELLSDFVVVGVIEEACKYILMGRATWNNPAFNCRYDGVVYAVFLLLGFAGMENVMLAGSTMAQACSRPRRRGHSCSWGLPCCLACSTGRPSTLPLGGTALALCCA